MVQVFAVSIMRWQGADKEPVLLASYQELSQFAFFKRGTVRELVMFFSRMVVRKTCPGERQAVEQGEHNCFAFVDKDSLGVAVVTDSEYPERVAFALASMCLREFVLQHGDSWERHTTDTTLKVPEMATLLKKYQNPEEADAISRVQSEIEEVKEVMHHTMEQLLDRGEKLDDIIEKSTDLGRTSRSFLHQSQENNACVSCGPYRAGIVPTHATVEEKKLDYEEGKIIPK